MKMHERIGALDFGFIRQSEASSIENETVGGVVNLDKGWTTRREETMQSLEPRYGISFWYSKFTCD